MLRYLSKTCGALVVVALVSAFCTEAVAQIKFVQITDPHLFDEEETPTSNWPALAAAVKRLNELTRNGRQYEFVVVTGDLGIEGLVSQSKGAETSELSSATIATNIAQGARKLALVLAASRVTVWLFVPGNNDLYDEKPESVRYYHQFIEKLREELNRKDIRDMCPEGQAGVFSTQGYSFIGFNDASFKNQNDPDRLKARADGGTECKREQNVSIHEAQLKQVRLVKSALDGLSTKQAYVFYHIPEIDDPYFVTLSADDKRLQLRVKEAACIGDRFRYSAWLVDREIRDAWDAVVGSEKVNGLFAGHFHDSHRETYLGVRWLLSPGYSAALLSKLYVCPPLAAKKQEKAKEQARGFLEVSIDGTGRILNETGKPGVRVFWYDEATQTFDTDEEDRKEVDAQYQLLLGQMFERNGRLGDAGASFLKALDSNFNGTRASAYSSLRRVTEKQSSPLNRYFYALFDASLGPEESLLFLVLLGFVVLLILLLLDRYLPRWLTRKSIVIIGARGLTLGAMVSVAAVICLIFLVMIWMIGPHAIETVRAPLPTVVEVFLLIVFALGDLGILVWLMRKRGKSKMEIVPLADATQSKLGATFSNLLIARRKRAIEDYRLRMLLSTVPWEVFVVESGDDREIDELVDSTVSGNLGKLAAWLIRRATRPEFSIQGSLQSGDPGLIILLVNLKTSSDVFTWTRTFPETQWFARAGDVAYEIVTQVMGSINE